MEEMICIEGNIGAGKSEVLKCLQKKSFSTYQEPVEAWTLLKKFYDDPKTYAFSFQLQVLASYALSNQNIIYERSVFSGLKVFAELLYESEHIKKHQYDLLTLCAFELVDCQPKLVIYLDVDSSECFQRIKQRNRKGEENITEEYLKNIEKKYEIFLKEMENVEVKVLRIHCKNLTPEEISEIIIPCL